MPQHAPSPFRFTTKPSSKSTKDSSSGPHSTRDASEKTRAGDSIHSVAHSSTRFASTPRFRAANNSSLNRPRTAPSPGTSNDNTVANTDDSESTDITWRTPTSKRQKLSPDVEGDQAEPGSDETFSVTASSAVQAVAAGPSTSKRRFITRSAPHTANEHDVRSKPNSDHSPLQHRHRTAFLFPPPFQSPANATHSPSLGQSLANNILLSAIFSPHRASKRTGGDRFVPGGWAAQVREWVVDLAHTSAGPIHHAVRDAGSTAESSAVPGSLAAVVHAEMTAGSAGQVKVRLEELNITTTDASSSAAIAFTLARATIVQGSLPKRTALICLVGHGSAAAQHQPGGASIPVPVPVAVPVTGSMVAVKPPVWDVELDDQVWTVVVDWLVL